MDILFPWLLFTAFLAITCFNLGKWSKEYPADEEMFRRLVESRRNARIKKEVEADLDAEITRQSAHT